MEFLMHKCRALLLFLASSWSAFAMEDNSANVLRSLLPTWFSRSHTSKEAKPIRGLRKSKNKFEKQLQTNKVPTKYMLPMTDVLCLIDVIDKHPIEFLKYCYHRNMHTYICMRIEQLDESASLFNNYKDIYIDGYSALGAAIIADIDIEPKRDFIKRLMKHGFELTIKDKAVATLELYDAIISKQKEVMVCLLSTVGPGNFLMLPRDIRKNIMWCMMPCLNKMYGLLPDN